MGKGFQRGDAALKVTRALPNGAVAVNSVGLDLEVTPAGDFLADCELLLTAPPLTTGILGNGATMTYDIEHDDASDFSTPVVLHKSAIVQTGAGGVGAAAAMKRVRLPTDVKRYVRFKATNSAAGNASTVNGSLEIVT